MQEDGWVVCADGRLEWRVGGRLHREGDQPARVWPDGSQEWCLHGQLHREGDQPARITADGTREWYLYGQLHREGDQPARIWGATGSQEWHLNGQLHREGDKPTVVWADGSELWYCNDGPHREGGKPAFMLADGTHSWYTHGFLTRTARVTNFEESSDRFALVRAAAAIGLAACVPCATTGSAPGRLLQAVQVHCDTYASSYHVGHEHAFLVALFL